MAAETTTTFIEVRNWLEVFYFASQVIVMFLVAFGLRQLQLTKRQIEITKEIFKTQSKRAAVEAAVVEGRRFADTLIQDKLALDKHCEENSISYFEDVALSISDDGFSINTKNVKESDLEKLSNATELINRILNGLESYALFFLSGVADENIAFHSNAKAYLELCGHMFKLFPILSVAEDDAEPIKALYFMWHKKYEAQKLKVEQQKIEKKLSTYKDSSIKPIGT